MIKWKKWMDRAVDRWRGIKSIFIPKSLHVADAFWCFTLKQSFWKWPYLAFRSQPDVETTLLLKKHSISISCVVWGFFWCLKLTKPQSLQCKIRKTCFWNNNVALSMASDEKTLMCVILEGMNPPPTDLLCGWHSSVMAMKVAAAEMGGWMDGSVLLSKSCYRCMNALISAKNMSHVWFPAFWVTAWPCELSPYGMSVYSWFSLWRIHCFISFTQISLTPPCFLAKQ